MRRELEPAAPPEGLAGFVYHLTEGNPLFMVDLLSRLPNATAVHQNRCRLATVPAPHRAPAPSARVDAKYGPTDTRAIERGEPDPAHRVKRARARIRQRDRGRRPRGECRIHRGSARDARRGGQVISKVADRGPSRRHGEHRLRLHARALSEQPVRLAQRDAQAIIKWPDSASCSGSPSSHARVAARVAILYQAAHDAPRAVHYFLMAAQHAARMSAFPKRCGSRVEAWRWCVQCPNLVRQPRASYFFS